MAKQHRGYDVWLTAANRVYRAVPYDVLTDWLQQGRVVAGDRVRADAAADWQHVADLPAFAAFLPRAEPDVPADAAEAFEPVTLPIVPSRRRDDDDDDVDMIPLIDVSLVLLIFFMLTASGVGAAAFIPTPPAEFGSISPNPREVQLNINLQDDTPVYSLSVGNKYLSDKDADLRTLNELLDRLRVYLEDDKTPPTIEVTINAHPDVKSGLVRELMVRLEEDKTFRGRVERKFYGVSEK